jgi:hypothetical protein
LTSRGLEFGAWLGKAGDGLLGRRRTAGCRSCSNVERLVRKFLDAGKKVA